MTEQGTIRWSSTPYNLQDMYTLCRHFCCHVLASWIDETIEEVGPRMTFNSGNETDDSILKHFDIYMHAHKTVM